MAYNLPQFNVEVRIWYPDVPISAAPSAETTAQLRHPRLTLDQAVFAPRQWTNDVPLTLCWILLPKNTLLVKPTGLAQRADGYIRCTRIELPTGSGRLYVVLSFEDRVLGFANEHVAAAAFRYEGGPQPFPVVAADCGGHALMAEKYRVEIAGVTGVCAVLGRTCGELNGTYDLTWEAGSCIWQRLNVPMCWGGLTGLQLYYTGPAGPGEHWTVNIAGPFTVYRLPAAAFQPFAANVFPLADPGAMTCVMPPTVRVSPAG